MSVPKAAMHKDNLTPDRENQIWAAWKVLPVQAVAIAEAMNNSAHGPFRASITALHAGHTLAALGARKGVRHSETILLIAFLKKALISIRLVDWKIQPCARRCNR